MNFSDWQTNWDNLGKDDPLWVILTDPSKKGGRWEPAEFFATGVAEIAHLHSQLDGLGHPVSGGTVLDFGCGVGRLTQALAAHHDRVHGVDISASMIGHANRFNRFGEQCVYHVNPREDLALFPPDHFDLIYSNIVLQHIPPANSLRYLREFFRVLKPGGIAVFQLLTPTWCRRLFPQFVVDAVRQIRHRGKPFIGMFGIPQRQLVQLMRSKPVELLKMERVNDSTSNELGWRWISHRFFVRKRPGHGGPRTGVKPT